MFASTIKISTLLIFISCYSSCIIQFREPEPSARRNIRNFPNWMEGLFVCENSLKSISKNDDGVWSIISFYDMDKNPLEKEQLDKCDTFNVSSLTTNHSFIKGKIFSTDSIIPVFKYKNRYYYPIFETGNLFYDYFNIAEFNFNLNKARGHSSDGRIVEQKTSLKTLNNRYYLNIYIVLDSLDHKKNFWSVTEFRLNGKAFELRTSFINPKENDFKTAYLKDKIKGWRGVNHINNEFLFTDISEEKLLSLFNDSNFLEEVSYQRVSLNSANIIIAKISFLLICIFLVLLLLRQNKVYKEQKKQYFSNFNSLRPSYEDRSIYTTIFLIIILFLTFIIVFPNSWSYIMHESLIDTI